MKYRVETYFEDRGICQTDDAKKAVDAWLKNAKKYPTDLAILAENKTAAIELIEWCDANTEYITQRCEEYRVPYKSSYLVEGIKKEKENNCRGFQWDGDQVYPFSYG